MKWVYLVQNVCDDYGELTTVHVASTLRAARRWYARWRNAAAADKARPPAHDHPRDAIIVRVMMDNDAFPGLHDPLPGCERFNVEG